MYNTAPSHAFMVWCQIKHWDGLSFLLPHLQDVYHSQLQDVP